MNEPELSPKKLHVAIEGNLHLSKHSRLLPVDDDENPPRFRQFSFTKRNPWKVRAERRTKNKRARAARKVNR